ncbi:unnamed protein product [Rotaria sp. Silwood1]|nr:unnamed protein product [Rotaria sp. Silwood1]CAF4847091.1 unnamed protein product [Rotaria sp. Silwood1]
MPSDAFFLSQRLPHTHNQQGLNSLYNQRITSLQEYRRPLEIKPIGGFDVAGKLNQWGINHRGQVATLENGERFLVHKGPGFGHNSQTVVVDANQMSRKWTPHGSSVQPGSQSVGLGVNLNYRRLFTKEGDINLIRLNIEQRRRRHLRDFFTSLLEFGWCSILSLLALSFVLSWLIFAGFWFLIMHIHGDFSHNSANSTWIPYVAGVRTLVGVVLFSIETQQTIGYGTRSVTEQCESGVILLAIHTCFGLVMQALWAGIVYSKLARPKNRRRTLIWSRQAVIFLRDRYLTLQVRIADIRPRSTLVEAHVRMYFIAERVTNEKEKIPLNILDMNVGLDTGRDRLLLMWPLTIEHRIDFKSPL